MKALKEWLAAIFFWVLDPVSKSYGRDIEKEFGSQTWNGITISGKEEFRAPVIAALDLLSQREPMMVNRIQVCIREFIIADPTFQKLPFTRFCILKKNFVSTLEVKNLAAYIVRKLVLVGGRNQVFDRKRKHALVEYAFRMQDEWLQELEADGH